MKISQNRLGNIYFAVPKHDVEDFIEDAIVAVTDLFVSHCKKTKFL